MGERADMEDVMTLTEGMEPIKVSVVIPVYNTEQYLEECLQSVINQSLREIEIICVDDGSPDHSMDILVKYAAADKRIQIIRQENGGQSKARNAGIRAARGEYLYFLDSDDYIALTMLERMYGLMKEKELDIAYFDAALSFECDELRYGLKEDSYRSKNKYEGVYEGTDLFCEFIQKEEAWVSPAWQLWNREFIIKNEFYFYENIFYEDVLFVFKALLNARRVMRINEVYYTYRLRRNSTITSDKKEQRLQGLFIAYCQILKYWEGHTYPEHVNQCIDKYAASWLGKIRRLSERVHSDNELVYGTCVEKYLYRTLVLRKKNGALLEDIGKEQMDQIRRFDHVIVYGTGAVAQEAIRILQREGVRIQHLAVSANQKREGDLFGIKITIIDELSGDGENCMVVVAVRDRCKDEMEQNLIRLKFKNYLFV